MTENKTVDARGLSCPQPVIMTRQAINEIGKGSLEVLVDSGTARDNVTRLAKKSGWSVKIVESSAENYRLVLQK